MYKTVRHGDNSLQYKILAQQEDGLTVVGTKNRPRPHKYLLLSILFIISFITSAILVPFLLKQESFTLTETKVSVSTIRRTQSSNHVVVIAKKPFGWNAFHPSASTKVPDTSQTHLPDAEAGIRATNSSFTSKLSSIIPSTSKPSTVEITTKSTTTKLPETTPKNEIMTSVRREHELKVGPSKPTEIEKVHRTENGKVYHNALLSWVRTLKEWNLEHPGINKLLVCKIVNIDVLKFMINFALFLLVFILMTIILRKRLLRRRIVIEEGMENNERLLKSPAGEPDGK